MTIWGKVSMTDKQYNKWYCDFVLDQNDIEQWYSNNFNGMANTQIGSELLRNILDYGFSNFNGLDLLNFFNYMLPDFKDYEADKVRGQE